MSALPLPTDATPESKTVTISWEAGQTEEYKDIADAYLDPNSKFLVLQRQEPDGSMVSLQMFSVKTIDSVFITWT